MRDSKAKKEDFFIKLTVMQTVLAVITGLVFFAAFKFSAAFFGELKSGYSELMANDMDVNDFIPYNFMHETTSQAESVTLNDTKSTADKSENTSQKNGAGGEDAEASATVPAVNTEVLDGFPTPVMPVNGTYSSYFGNRIHPVYGTEGFHYGLDIAADEGTPVYAAFDGTVNACGVGEMSGNYVKLDNGSGVETLYCHCSKINVTDGQKVKRGDIIAFVGQTGLATGPHLHFELHINGEKCDPEPLLRNAVSVS